MLRFDIITIFPEIFDSYFNESIIKRAQKKKFIKINIHNLRDFAKDERKTVDDKPYGGGPGMILKIDVIFRAVKSIIAKNKSIKNKERKIILLSAKGKKFNQAAAFNWTKFKQVILICGRYEGVDERVAEHIANEEISIGDYVLTGGELPAMVLIDAVSRLVKGVIKPESLKEESFSGLAGEYPQYTRPEVFVVPTEARRAKVGAGGKISWKVPKILLSGHHQKIKEWHKKKSLSLEKNQKKC